MHVAVKGLGTDLGPSAQEPVIRAVPLKYGGRRRSHPGFDKCYFPGAAAARNTRRTRLPGSRLVPACDLTMSLKTSLSDMVDIAMFRNDRPGKLVAISGSDPALGAWKHGMPAPHGRA